MQTKKLPKLSAINYNGYYDFGSSNLIVNSLEEMIKQGVSSKTILDHFGISLSRLKHQRSKKGTNGLVIYYTHFSTNIALLWAMQNDKLVLANFHIWEDYMNTVNNDTFMLIASFLHHVQKTLETKSASACPTCGK